MVDLARQIRREALQANASADPQDLIDERGALADTPQELHERMLAEDAAEETIDVLEGLRSLQSGELVNWAVHRIAGPHGDPLRSGASEFVGVLGSSQLTQENMARLWGGGRYRVRGRYSNGQIAGGRTITIAADAKREESLMPAVAAPGPSFNLSEWLALQAQADARREEKEREREDRAEKRRTEMLALMAPIVGGIVTALIARPVAAAPPGPDPIASMKAMAETLATLQGLTGGSGGEGDSLVEIVKAVAPHAGPALAALAARQQATPAPAFPRPAPGSQPSQPVAVRVVEPEPAPKPAPAQPVPAHTGVDLDAPSQSLSDQDRIMFAQLKPQVDALVTLADQGADPVQTAEVFFETVMSRLDDTNYNTVADFLSDPHALTKIAIFNTGVKKHQVFFETFQKRVIEMITAEDHAVSASPS